MEELIEAVRSEKCLYDVKHQDYMNKKLKDSVWKRIAEALNLKDGSEAKKSWEKLRNNHRDALRRQKISKPKSGSGAVNIKAWSFQENMTFLIPHMANRPINTNVNEDILNDESSHSNSNTIENDIQKNINDTDIHESGVEETNETPESQSTGTSAGQGNKRRQKKKTLNNLLTKSIEDHERRLAKRQQERERLIAYTNYNDFTISNVKNHPLFHFFISVYETTKRLPPLSQHNIKTNIFSLVSQEESKNLVEYSPRPPSSYS
ncbi:unnamed protein product [Acanthoscelides obtectus]|uniref:MADF domain-containing protein n=1 Tax=Acanthoscelides obtectus TaxID=200917 RepID=A0A9P0PPS9_ACAOB|nr:unnamed protein product [Acanthoscelides obtectus]CAK1663340.1 hypothetical protein AOBTE_LOCUS23618 [Acanthoscelides obtectus]